MCASVSVHQHGHRDEAHRCRSLVRGAVAFLLEPSQQLFERPEEIGIDVVHRSAPIQTVMGCDQPLEVLIEGDHLIHPRQEPSHRLGLYVKDLARRQPVRPFRQEMGLGTRDSVLGPLGDRQVRCGIFAWHNPSVAHPSCSAQAPRAGRQVGSTRLVEEPVYQPRAYAGRVVSETGMSWREFVASLVGSLAWPIAVVTAIALLRTQLAKLLEGRVKRLQVGPASIEYWEDTVDQVELNVAAFEPSAVHAGGGSALTDYGDELARLREIAEETPIVAVNDAFRLVDSELRNVAREARWEDADQRPVRRLLHDLDERQFLPRETAVAVMGLITLRNVAAHDDGSGLTVTPKQARDFVRLTEQVVFALQAAAARPAGVKAAGRS